MRGIKPLAAQGSHLAHEGQREDAMTTTEAAGPPVE
ncbi:MAG: hypothetical protein QOC85_2127, partial [Streptomyces sp.]|nr:hypothetical protein [Streptomyces sp.]